MLNNFSLLQLHKIRLGCKAQLQEGHLKKKTMQSKKNTSASLL